MNLTARILVSLICSVPFSVIVAWFIITHLRLQEKTWPRMVAACAFTLSIVAFLVF